MLKYTRMDFHTSIMFNAMQRMVDILRNVTSKTSDVIFRFCVTHQIQRIMQWEVLSWLFQSKVQD